MELLIYCDSLVEYTVEPPFLVYLEHSIFVL
jgi:hypothetical protein